MFNIFESWISFNKVSMQESYQQTIAIIIKLNSEDHVVRFFKSDKDVDAYQTDFKVKKKIVMMFLNVDHSCWLICNAFVKYITHDQKKFESAQD